MNPLSEKEQRHVRTALRFLRLRAGRWETVAQALGCKRDTLSDVANGHRPVSANMAVRIARFVEASVDDLLAGRWLSPRACPHCGAPPEDFVDEETIVEQHPRPGA